MGIVIIGTGLAGYGAAREFRRHDTGSPLTLVTAGVGEAYSKPALSTALRKGQQPDDLVQAEAEAMATELDAQVRTSTPVEHIDTERRRVHLASGEIIAYERLLLAVGADPAPAPLGGDGTDRVFRVNSLSEYRHLRTALADAQRVVIMGGGLVGCEFADDLARGGFEVELVHTGAYPLDGLLPDPAGAALGDALDGLGVVRHPGTTVEAVAQRGAGIEATLADGRRRPCGLVLSAVGLRPRIGLAEEAGLRVRRGICVDRWLATSDPHIHALGDCAEICGRVMPYVAPITYASRALGRTLAGEPTPAEFPVMPVSVKTGCLPTVVEPPDDPHAGQWHFDGTAPDLRGEFRDANGALTGFVLTGRRMRERMALTRAMTGGSESAG